LEIVIAQPPTIAAILEIFPEAAKPDVIFAFGDKIYNPSGNPIPRALMAHERVHGMRQLTMGLDVEQGVMRWWAQYLDDKSFRFEEELKAHAAEFREQAYGLDSNHRAKLLMATARRLIAPLYAYDDWRPPLPRAMTLLREELDHG
jgi:hypothetical protein